MITIQLWQFIAYGLISGIIGAAIGAIITHVNYKKALTDKERRLTAVLERMDALATFIKSEILHIDEATAPPPKK